MNPTDVSLRILIGFMLMILGSFIFESAEVWSGISQFNGIVVSCFLELDVLRGERHRMVGLSFGVTIPWRIVIVSAQINGHLRA